MTSSIANHIFVINKAPSIDVRFYLYLLIGRNKRDSKLYHLRNFLKVECLDVRQILPINVKLHMIDAILLNKVTFINANFQIIERLIYMIIKKQLQVGIEIP